MGAQKKEIKRLIGDDAQIYTGDVSHEVIKGDGEKTLDELLGGTAGDQTGAGFYLIETKAASSFFPAKMKEGEMYPALGTEVLNAGDEVKKLNLTQLADCGGWSLDISQDKVDVTVLADEFKKARPGKKDASGTCKQLFIQGITDEDDGMIDRTIKTFRRDKDGNVTISEALNKSMYMIGYINKAKSGGERESYIFAQIYMYGMKLGADSGSAQSYDSNFSLTGADPVFYSIDLPY